MSSFFIPAADVFCSESSAVQRTAGLPVCCAAASCANRNEFLLQSIYSKCANLEMAIENIPADPTATRRTRHNEQVMPTVMSPKASAVERLSRCIPPSIPAVRRDPPFVRTYRDSPGRLTTSRAATDAAARGAGAGRPGGKTGSPCGSSAASIGTTGPDTATSAPVHCTDHLTRTVPTSAAVIVYAFNAADQLVKGLLAASGSGGRGTAAGVRIAGVGGDSDDHRKCVLLRATTATTAGGSGGDGGGGNGGFGPALEAGLSRPVLADEMGETHLWVVDSHGRRHLAAAFVSLQRATVFITLSASAQFPPFRVENRSSAETLAYRQVGMWGIGERGRFRPWWRIGYFPGLSPTFSQDLRALRRASPESFRDRLSRRASNRVCLRANEFVAYSDLLYAYRPDCFSPLLALRVSPGPAETGEKRCSPAPHLRAPFACF